MDEDPVTSENLRLLKEIEAVKNLRGQDMMEISKLKH